MSNSNFNIVQQNDRFALYQDGILVNTYSRKDSAVRRMKKMQLAEFTEFMKEVSEDTSSIESEKQADESELNFVCRVAGESFYIFNNIFKLLSVSDIRSVARTHALTQRDERGAERVGARSPPP